MQGHYKASSSPIHASTNRGTALPQHLASTTGVGATVAHLASAFHGGNAGAAAPTPPILAQSPELEPYTSGLPSKGS